MSDKSSRTKYKPSQLSRKQGEPTFYIVLKWRPCNQKLRRSRECAQRFIQLAVRILEAVRLERVQYKLIYNKS